MRTILSTLILSLLVMSGSAQQLLSKKVTNIEDAKVYNYVVLTKKVDQLKPILLAAQALSKEDEKQFGSFEIIVCGKDIVEMTDEKKMEGFLKEAEELGASIIACGFSLKKFDVDPDKLPKNVKVIDNGILYNIELQKKGYLSLEL